MRAHPDWTPEQIVVEAVTEACVITQAANPGWSAEEVMTEVQRIVAVGPCPEGRVMSTAAGSARAN